MARQQRNSGRSNGGEKKEYDNTNRVTLWVTEQFIDGSNPKAPTLRGTVNVEGVDYSISFWLNNDLKDLEQDLADVLGDMTDEAGKKPVFRGNIQPKDDNKKSSASGGRSSGRRGRSRNEDSDSDEEEWA